MTQLGGNGNIYWCLVWKQEKNVGRIFQVIMITSSLLYSYVIILTKPLFSNWLLLLDKTKCPRNMSSSQKWKQWNYRTVSDSDSNPGQVN